MNFKNFLTKKSLSAKKLCMFPNQEKYFLNGFFFPKIFFPITNVSINQDFSDFTAFRDFFGHRHRQIEYT